MSYLQRESDGSNPFAQVYNSSANWNYNLRPDTVTENWLTNNSDVGYTFTGSGYIFGFMTAASSSLAELRFVSSSAARYKSGFFCSTGVQTYDSSDDEAIGYGNNVQTYPGVTYPGKYGTYSPQSRLNIIRMEAT